MEKKNLRKSFIWNVLGTGLNAFNSLFFLITVTRINGIKEAGIFTIAFSTACMLYVIGTYSGRIYQVTENNKNIGDGDYVIHRTITCFCMMLITFGLIIIRKYDIHKSIIFVLLNLYKCLEAFSDVLYGIMQKNNKLDVVGKSYFIKSMLSILFFVFLDIITKNITVSCMGIILIWILVMLLYDKKVLNKMSNKRIQKGINVKNIYSIFREGFYVFAISFLGIYLINASKYAIDRYLDDDVQAIYGIIIMPATVMSLLSQFLIHPYLTAFLDFIKNKKFKELKMMLVRINLLIFLCGIIATIVAYTVGITILNFIYNIQLNNYAIHLAIIIIAATIYNIGIIYSSVLTTMRKTSIQFIIYIISTIIAIIFANIGTYKYAINGAIGSYFLVMFIFFTLYEVISNLIIYKEYKKSFS